MPALRRRDFISLLGGAAAAWPLAAGAQQSGKIGVTSLNIEVAPKRLELLHELLPSVTTMGLLVNPAVPALAAPVSRISQAAAHSLGLQLHVVHASSDRDFDAVFEKLIQLHAGALVIGPEPLHCSQRTTRYVDGSARAARGIRISRVRRCWWSDELWQ